MEHYCLLRYRQMQKELQGCNQNSCCYKAIEASFRVANKYWNLVKERLHNYQFKMEQAEIEFFKVLKPKFTSEIEYYILLFQGLLFEPPDLISAVNFWGREYHRFEKFKAENASFIDCYKSGNSELVPYYFLRRYYISNNDAGVKLYDAGTRAITNGDHLAATYIALTRYQVYVENRLKLLLQYP